MKTTPAREWDWVSAGLLFMLLQVAAARLVRTEWAPNLYWTETLAGFGTILGLALGVSRFRRGAVLGLAAGYTAIVLPWQLTRSVNDLYLGDRLSRVGGILAHSFDQFSGRQPVKDTLFFLLFVCLAFWLLGVLAGYWLGRHGRVLSSIALSGAAIMLTQAYGNYQAGGSLWLALYALIALLLAGRVHFLAQKTQLLRDRVFVSEEAGANVLAGLFLTAALAVLAAWWLPGMPGRVQRVADAWNSYFRPMRERLSNAVTSLKGPQGDVLDSFYGSELAVGQQAASGDEEVFTVDVVESPASNARYYWRGRVYNNYEAGLWTASGTSRLLLDPSSDDLQIPDASDRSEALFLVTSYFPTQRLIYGPAPAVWLDRSANVAALRTGPDVYDPFVWEARTVVSEGSTYRIRSALHDPSEQQLREAGEEYPSWVTREYMGVPGKYRPELAALAEEITAGSENAYDKAAAIAEYLRRNIEYSASVPAPPLGRDPVIWVLFDYRRGFCNYYASAQVLLLRSIGVPARLAVGFAQGAFEDGAYVVHRRNAHAWPEVYFPGIGWVEFEPTRNQNPLIRPSGGETVAGPIVLPAQGSSLGLERDRFPEDVEVSGPGKPLPFWLTPAGRTLYVALPILLTLLALVLVHRLRILQRLPAFLIGNLEAGGGSAPTWLRQWEHWNRLGPLERAFASISWTLRLLGMPQPTNATPARQAAALARVMPSAARQINELRHELESGLFSPNPADVSRARRAGLVVLMHGLRASLYKAIAEL